MNALLELEPRAAGALGRRAQRILVARGSTPGPILRELLGLNSTQWVRVAAWLVRHRYAAHVNEKWEVPRVLFYDICGMRVTARYSEGAYRDPDGNAVDLLRLHPPRAEKRRMS